MHCKASGRRTCECCRACTAVCGHMAAPAGAPWLASHACNHMATVALPVCCCLLSVIKAGSSRHLACCSQPRLPALSAAAYTQPAGPCVALVALLPAAGNGHVLRGVLHLCHCERSAAACTQGVGRRVACGQQPCIVGQAREGRTLIGRALSSRVFRETSSRYLRYKCRAALAAQNLAPATRTPSATFRQGGRREGPGVQLHALL